MKTLIIKDSNYLIIALLGIIVFSLCLDRAHLFDWDEVNFAESAREMIVTGDFMNVQINYNQFWEKPPLFIWMQALSMLIFGINEFAARFPNAICGVVTLLVLYRIGKELKNKKLGIIWVLTYASSFLPFFYFKSGIIDPWFNLFIFLGIYYATKYTSPNSRQTPLMAVLSGLFIGLATLTKGPVAILIFSIVGVVLLIIKGFKIMFKPLHFILFLITLLLSGGFWFILQLISGNYVVLADFLEYQIRLFNTHDAGHGGFVLYHFIVLFFGVFPASIFALHKVKFDNNTTSVAHMRLVMKILLFTVLTLFTIVKTKIMHYSSLAYFPITLLAAFSIYHYLKHKKPAPIYSRILMPALALIYAIPMFVLSIFEVVKTMLINGAMINDKFAVENLKADVSWTGYEFIIGLIILGGAIYFFIYSKKRLKLSLIILAISSILYINLTTIYVVPKIEGYTQRAAIEFYKSCRDKDVYVETLGFKSYAQYFYSNKQYQTNNKHKDLIWLERGEVDKKVYFVSKVDRVHKYLENNSNLKVIGQKNGFVFLTRVDSIR